MLYFSLGYGLSENQDFVSSRLSMWFVLFFLGLGDDIISYSYGFPNDRYGFCDSTFRYSMSWTYTFNMFLEVVAF